MRAAATRRAHLCRGCAGSRKRGGARGALWGSEVLQKECGGPEGGGGAQHPDPHRHAPTFHQQAHGAQRVTPQVAAVPPGVLRPQPPQQQRVAPPQRPPPPRPQHGAVGRLPFPAQQRHVGSGAAQHRVLRQRWEQWGGRGSQKVPPKLPASPKPPRCSPSLCTPKAPPLSLKPLSFLCLQSPSVSLIRSHPEAPHCPLPTCSPKSPGVPEAPPSVPPSICPPKPPLGPLPPEHPVAPNPPNVRYP